jgi:hypothetical protein
MLSSRYYIVAVKLFLLHLSWILRGTESFAGAQPPPSTEKRGPTALYAGKEQIRFTVDLCVASEPLPTESKEEAYNFFNDDKILDYFLGAGKKAIATRHELTPEMLQMWKEACEYYGPEYLPGQEDKIIVRKTTVDFPGIQLLNEVFSGVKKLKEGEGPPAYQCCLIAERRTVTGLPPLVWLFNKLTGSSPDDEYTRNSAKGHTRITLVEKEGERKFVIGVQSHVLISMEFPKVFVKLFPAPKSKMEEQGNKAVEKAVRREIDNSFEVLEEAFLNWRAKAVAA